MTRTSRFICTSLVCDRCGTSADLSDDANGLFREAGWADFRARASAPHRIIPDARGDGMMIAIGGEFKSADLCPPCADELFAWWHAGKAAPDQDQPQ